jgi:predicted dinucleotide-binding enzyme
MKIAIIGAGNVGKTLGTALRSKGHTVVYGSRNPAATPRAMSRVSPTP